MTFLKQNWLKIVLIILAISIIGFQYLQNLNLKYDIIYLKAVPRVELFDIAQFGEGNGLSNIDISGFVAFYNTEDQPKNVGQYYRIQSIAERDSNGRQLFVLNEVIAFHNLAPRDFDTRLLSQKSNTATELVLTDESGNIFTINKLNKKVTMYDITGDRTYLITNQSEYEDFIIDLLK